MTSIRVVLGFNILCQFSQTVRFYKKTKKIIRIEQWEYFLYGNLTNDVTFFIQNLKIGIFFAMGGQASGALNISGFSESIKQKRLPHYEHITFNGIFNENFFEVGDRANDLLQIHHGVGISNCDLYDLPKRNYFISLFMKSNTDGQKRTRPINAVVCLDVSGSMNSMLKYGQNPSQEDKVKTRLNLARKAIEMLYEKLQPEDVFGLVTFQTQAHTIIKSQFKKDLDPDYVKKMINSKFTSGGTTIKQGFNESVKNIKEFLGENSLERDYEHRIIMLTDVDDNSVQNEKILIDKISSQDNINTTIIGVSSNFKSTTCEDLVEVKGFNYFCAVQNEDLQTYLADRFDYNFFPCVKKVKIGIESEEIESFEVFGTVDSKRHYDKEGNELTVTKMETGFPSQLQTNKKGMAETQGGLILVKLRLKNEGELPHLRVKINLSYQDLNSQEFHKQYLIDNKLQVEQYYSDEAIEKGVRLFYYAHTMRKLLKDMIQGGQGKVLSDSNKNLYGQKLQKLKQFAPKQKLDQLQAVIDIVQSVPIRHIE